MAQPHSYVKHTVTPVEVLIDDEGEPVVFVDPDQVPVSESSSVYGCDLCGMPISEAHGTECPGLSEDDS